MTVTAERATGRRMSSLQDRVIILGRRPLLLAFLLGCSVSMLASGRFTLRLIVDGTLSFAFVPLSGSAPSHPDDIGHPDRVVGAE
jgi:hypothetical protein